jgi:hypothetical protein
VNGRLSVDQAPRSLLIRQRVDAEDAASRRSADTLAAAAEDPKVVDDDKAAMEAHHNTRGEDLLIHHLITSFPPQIVGCSPHQCTSHLDFPIEMSEHRPFYLRQE